MDPATPKSACTCSDYRQEMILLSLSRRLADAELPESEKELLRRQIKKIEADLSMS